MEQFNLNSMRLLAGACVGTLPTGVVYPATLTSTAVPSNPVSVTTGQIVTGTVTLSFS
jgi:hypothetical protein